jgi:hypothetical protein
MNFMPGLFIFPGTRGAQTRELRQGKVSMATIFVAMCRKWSVFYLLGALGS